MGKSLVVVPDGWPVVFGDCRPGLFVHNDTLCVLSQFNGPCLAVDGQPWWGGVSVADARDSIVVQPVRYEWVNTS